MGVKTIKELECIRMIGYIASQGNDEDYRFLYACCVLQLVANKIVEMEK